MEGEQEEFRVLSARKSELEDEIASITQELTTGPMAPGIQGPLTDSEGFPRNDIDVYRARHQRHKLATLQTDHQVTMRRIETLLPILLRSQTLQKPANKPQNPPKAPAKAFAAIQNVLPNSPAQIAGLHNNDRIVRFGSADATNHRNLEAIRDIVALHFNQSIGIDLLRPQKDPKLIHIELIPRPWSGDGTIGCQFIAL